MTESLYHVLGELMGKFREHPTNLLRWGEFPEASRCFGADCRSKPSNQVRAYEKMSAIPSQLQWNAKTVCPLGKKKMTAKPAILVFLGIMLTLTSVAVAAPPPPFEVTTPAGTDKCISCHAWRQPDPTPRSLKKPHETLVFTHWPLPGAWCDQCHLPESPRQLILHHDQTAPFTEAHRLCNQCHATKVRDWLYGAHGKRIGNWQGPRRLLPCAACHNPHQPAWKPVVPSSPPARPGSQNAWKPVVPPPKTTDSQP